MLLTSLALGLLPAFSEVQGLPLTTLRVATHRRVASVQRTVGAPAVHARPAYDRGIVASCAASAEFGRHRLPKEHLRAPRRMKGSAPINGGDRDGDHAGRRQGKSDQVRELQRLCVSGGTYRGRRLETPSVYLRPMMSRVRESLFSMIQSTGVIRASMSALDLFAGSGAVGIECLSRGMGSATFVDFSPECVATIRTNCAELGVASVTRVVEGRVDDVLTSPKTFGLDQPFDLVTLTPPYEEVVYADLMDAMASSALLGEDTLVVVEYPVELGIFPPVLGNGRLVGLRNRRYGRTVIALYVNRPTGRLDMTPFSEEFVSLKTGKAAKLERRE